MKQLISTAFFMLFLCSQSLWAQSVSYGFKAGLNFSTIQGPSETGTDGSELESLDLINGFHIGGGVIFKIVDRFGVKAELLFSQKGTDYIFEGPSYKVFTTDTGDDFVSTGNRKMILNITNSYVDLPIMGYARFGKLELSAGVNVGVLVSSSANGELNYTALSTGGNELETIISILDYNYYKDEARQFVGDETEVVEIGPQDVVVPMSEGAYYEFNEKSASLFNTLDIGVNAGLSYFINRSLFFGLRVNYGLTDVTNNEVDYSRASLGDNNIFVPLEDVDKNLSLQASLGFSF